MSENVFLAEDDWMAVIVRVVPCRFWSNFGLGDVKVF